MSSRGDEAEQRAADFLTRRGLRLLARNFRCRYGEIDLILQDGDTLVFVEVRLRSRSDFGGAAASIDSHKQRKLTLAAQHYLAQLPRTPPCRFDAILMRDAGESIEWIKNAFTAW
ncbi:MAG: YraN family protein [Nitrosomonadales bacterium]|nr:YraN family protein [Nitrosomonadales bacterium]